MQNFSFSKEALHKLASSKSNGSIADSHIEDIKEFTKDRASKGFFFGTYSNEDYVLSYEIREEILKKLKAYGFEYLEWEYNDEDDQWELGINW